MKNIVNWIIIPEILIMVWITILFAIPWTFVVYVFNIDANIVRFVTYGFLILVLIIGIVDIVKDIRNDNN